MRDKALGTVIFLLALAHVFDRGYGSSSGGGGGGLAFATARAELQTIRKHHSPLGPRRNPCSREYEHQEYDHDQDCDHETGAHTLWRRSGIGDAVGETAAKLLADPVRAPPAPVEQTLEVARPSDVEKMLHDSGLREPQTPDKAEEDGMRTPARSSLSGSGSGGSKGVKRVKWADQAGIESLEHASAAPATAPGAAPPNPPPPLLPVPHLPTAALAVQRSSLVDPSEASFHSAVAGPASRGEVAGGRLDHWLEELLSLPEVRSHLPAAPKTVAPTTSPPSSPQLAQAIPERGTTQTAGVGAADVAGEPAAARAEAPAATPAAAPAAAHVHNYPPLGQHLLNEMSAAARRGLRNGVVYGVPFFDGSLLTAATIRQAQDDGRFNKARRERQGKLDALMHDVGDGAAAQAQHQG